MNLPGSGRTKYTHSKMHVRLAVRSPNSKDSTPSSLERVNIDQVLYKSYYNDISVLVDGQLILMIEHQSTINPNIPLRLLEHASRVFGNIVDSRANFSQHLADFLAKT